MVPIPVYAARLPRAAALLPYLQAIDASGQYSNRGPLVGRLEARMAAVLGLPAGSVTVAASGTAALQGAILAAAGRARAARPVALVPAYTFVATAHAVQACGYEMAFSDVSRRIWAMDPTAVLDWPGLERVGVVVPVAPYGMAFDAPGWAAFQARTGIPVVIDAAASFEAVAREPGCITADLPVVLSLHATKTVSAAEGGAVLWRDPAGLQRVTEAVGFGLTGAGQRSVTGPGLNGRMSEYHAAVGLACLDGVEGIAAERLRLRAAYAAAAGRAGVDAGLLLGWPAVGSNYALIEAPSLGAAERVVAACDAAGVGVRRWYGRGLHREPFFSGLGAGRYARAESLADRVLGVPVFPGMQPGQMDRVMVALRRGGLGGLL